MNIVAQINCELFALMGNDELDCRFQCMPLIVGNLGTTQAVTIYDHEQRAVIATDYPDNILSALKTVKDRQEPEDDEHTRTQEILNTLIDECTPSLTELVMRQNESEDDKFTLTADMGKEILIRWFGNPNDEEVFACYVMTVIKSVWADVARFTIRNKDGEPVSIYDVE